MARKRVTGAASPLDAAPNLGNALQLDQAILGQLRGLGGAQPGGLVIADDGTVSVGSFRLTGKGLIAQDGAPLEQWTQLLKVLAMMHGKIQLLIGDALAYGERQYKDTYQEVAAIFGRQVKTMYQWKWVCANVDLSVRTEKLTYTHYERVANLPQAQQAYWLKLADENGWSVKRLIEAMGLNESAQFEPLALPSDVVSKQHNPERAIQQFKNLVDGKLHLSKEERQIAIESIVRWLQAIDAACDQRDGSE